MPNLDPSINTNLYWVLPVSLLAARVLMGFLFALCRGDPRETWAFASEQAAEFPASLTVIAFAIAAGPTLKLLATGEAISPLTLVSVPFAYVFLLLIVAFFVFMGRLTDWYLLPAYLSAGVGMYLAVNAFQPSGPRATRTASRPIATTCLGAASSTHAVRHRTSGGAVCNALEFVGRPQ